MKLEDKKRPPTLLIILDGLGLANAKNVGNAVTPETAPNIFGYMEKYPSSKLIAHGEAVGLFPGQAGNSEAGHLNIGAGRVVEQDIVRISNAIKDGRFYKNEALQQGLLHAQKHKSAIHIMGLLADEDSGHARMEHLIALLEFFRRNKQKKVFLHLFTDGRDSPPFSSPEYLKKLRAHMRNGEKIATIMGRFYAMDRNKIWERTRLAYDTLVMGKGECVAESAEDAVSNSYKKGDLDEYICPTVITENGKPVATIKDNDTVFFFNARSDRARQLTKVFVQPNFFHDNPKSFHPSKKLLNIHFIGMSEFGPDLSGILTAFPSPHITNPLAAAIGEECHQLYLSETEKYAHVTYFLNGGYPKPVNGEKRQMVRSKKRKHFDVHPQMSGERITKIILDELDKEHYKFICVNYPNADMVGHTGNFEATKKAVTFIDEEIKKLVTATLKQNGQILLTSDHGNAEVMIDKDTKLKLTGHTTNPVPCILIKKRIAGIKMKKGKLTDVAPTVLKMLGLKKAKGMTGKPLF